MLNRRCRSIGIGKRLLKGKAHLLFCAAAFLCSIATSRAENAAVDEATRAAEFVVANRPLTQSSPDEGIGKLKDWLRENPHAGAAALDIVYENLILSLMGPAHDLTGAYAASEEAIGRLGQSAYAYQILIRQMQVLLAQNKLDQADALGAKYVDGAAAAGKFTLLPLYAQALQREGKADQLVAWSKKMLLQYPMLLSRGSDGISAPIYDPVIAALQATGDDDRALGWAKMQFMFCPFTESAIKAAGDQLARIIIARSLSPADVQAFIEAQQDPTKANPLAPVRLPISADEAKQALNAVPVDAAHVNDRIDLLLIAGTNREAMLLARQRLIDGMGLGDGVGEICLVFKASDLNIKRANDFLDFMKNGKGPNPVSEFFKDGAPAVANNG